MQYADPELLIAAWLHEQTSRKTWADPVLPANYDYTTPLGLVQRSPGEGDTALTLDAVLLDVDWYAKNADHARAAAAETWSLMRLALPQHTWPSGVTVNGVRTESAPSWAPATGVFRRSASYRVFLHGLI